MASDKSIARKLHQTFWPNLKYESYSNSFLHHDALPSFILFELYLKRSDAYLKKGDWHRARSRYRRADALPRSYVPDRWREISRTKTARNYIDMKAFDDTRKDAVRLWMKGASPSGRFLVRVTALCDLSLIVARARYAGLTGSPDESGAKTAEKGLARSGNARVRRVMIQLAWRFLWLQKDSALAEWYRQRTQTAPATRKALIVALARRAVDRTLALRARRHRAHGRPTAASMSLHLDTQHPKRRPRPISRA